MKIKQRALYFCLVRLGGILWLFLSLFRMIWIKEPYEDLRITHAAQQNKVMQRNKNGYMIESSQKAPSSDTPLPYISSARAANTTNPSPLQGMKENSRNLTLRNVRYMSRRAIALRREVESGVVYNQHQGPKTNVPYHPNILTRISPYPLHFFTFATSDMNLTLQRILLQAERSKFFVTVTGLGPDDLPIEFRRDYQDILQEKHGGGYYLWRYPVWEIMMQRVPWNEYVMYLDAGCTILSTGRDTLFEWLRRLEMSSQQQNSSNPNDIHEIMRFPEAKQFRELRWTTDAVLKAFGVDMDNIDVAPWWGVMKPQLFGGLLIVKNGIQWRNLTALIYEVLDKDPYLITDRYTNATQRRRPGRFSGFRHDQSISSVASKVLQTHILAPGMELWEKEINGTFIRPPFGVTRFRDITKSQLDSWTRACQGASRDMDDRCDHLANTLFELNSVVK